MTMRQVTTLAAFVISLLALLHPPYIFAAIVTPTGPNRLCDLQKIMEHAIRNAIIPLAAIVLFVMLIIGGLLYLTSGGDPKGTEQAKNTLTYAIAGIALLVIAWFALYFVETFTGVKVTIFNIPCPTGAG